jgi:protein TonB
VTSALQPGIDPSFGDVAPDAPRSWAWGAAFAVAIAAHVAVATPFLAPAGKPQPPAVEVDGDEGPGIGVTLAPLVAPPVVEAPPPEVEPAPKIEEATLEERASDSPPPAPPPEPRETLDLPDIQPRAIPEIWRGSGGGGGGVTLEEFIALQDWLAAARQEILDKLVYPAEARRLAQVGIAQIAITANRNGRILDWRFTQQTGVPALDEAIERSVHRVGRLPRFPADTKYDELSFNTRIVFVLMSGEDVVAAPEGAPVNPAAPRSQQPLSDPGMSVAELSQCARSAAGLASARAAIEASRVDLEALGAEYERRATREHAMGRTPSRRVRNMLRDYEAGLDAYNASAETFEADVAAYAAACGGGRAGWDNYRVACVPYVGQGNRYCEAYTDLWTRLVSGQ